MAFPLLGRAADLEIDPHPKLVLIALANRACEDCGFAWPGLKYLQRKTHLGETTITGALRFLLASGLVRVHRYPHGGRGRTTEYVVLEQFFKFSTAPCGECVQKQERGRVAGGFGKTGRVAGGFGDDTPREATGFNGDVTVNLSNPPPRDPETPRHATTIQSEIHIQSSRALGAREADPPASPPGATASPIPDHRRESIARQTREAKAEAKRLSELKRRF